MYFEYLMIFLMITINFMFGTFFTALILQLSTRLLYKFIPPYWMAYKAFLIWSLASVLLWFLIDRFGELLGTMSGFQLAIYIVVSYLLCFLLGGALIGLLIKRPESDPIGFIKGTMVACLCFVFIWAVSFFVSPIIELI